MTAENRRATSGWNQTPAIRATVESAAGPRECFAFHTAGRKEGVASDHSVTKTRIRSNGQLAIPEGVRERLGLEAGTEVSLEVQGDTLLLKRLHHPDWRSLRGMAQGGDSLTEALIAERASEKAHDDDIEDR